VSVMKYRYCPSCGTESNEGASFCAACGSSLEKPSVRAHTPVISDPSPGVTQHARHAQDDGGHQQATAIPRTSIAPKSQSETSKQKLTGTQRVWKYLYFSFAFLTMAALLGTIRGTGSRVFDLVFGLACVGPAILFYKHSKRLGVDIDPIVPLGSRSPKG
jgi:hypothetical protein